MTPANSNSMLHYFGARATEAEAMQNPGYAAHDRLLKLHKEVSAAVAGTGIGDKPLADLWAKINECYSAAVEAKHLDAQTFAAAEALVAPMLSTIHGELAEADERERIAGRSRIHYFRAALWVERIMQPHAKPRVQVAVRAAERIETTRQQVQKFQAAQT